MSLSSLDLLIGRLRLPTVKDAVKESVGGSLDADGPGVVVGRRRSKALGLSVPVSAYRSSVDPQVAGEQMRRQVRALLDNDRARADGHYLSFAADPALNGWVMIGAGPLDYGPGGRTLSDYELSLEELYRIGTPRTHREGRRVSAVDRRLSTTFLDELGLVTGGAYAAMSAVVLCAVPPAADYVVARQPLLDTGTPPGLAQRAGLDGTGRVATSRVNGDIITYERTEAQQRLGDVVIWDRQGNPTPANQSLGADADPQVNYGWEEVYGPGQELTAGDVPVIANGLCRVRYVSVAGPPVLAVDVFIAGTGYVEHGRVEALADDAGTTFAGAAMTLQAVSVVEWTQERGVLLLTSAVTAGGTPRLHVYVSLQRGWTGPRVECYAQRSTGNTNVALRYLPNDTGEQVALTPAGARSTAEAGWTGATLSTASNWVALLSPDNNSRRAAHIAWTQALTGARCQTSALAYGANRNGVELYVNSAAAVSWVSMNLGYGTVAGVRAEAEAIVNTGGTRTTVADANAVGAGSNTVNDTQTSEAAVTLSSTAASYQLPAGTYGVWARVRVTTSGDTGSVKAALTGSGSVSTPTVAFTSTSYVWVYLGETTVTATSTGLTVTAWRSAGTGTSGVRVDRVAVTRTAARQASPQNLWDGARDHGEASLWDVRAEPTLIER